MDSCFFRGRLLSIPRRSKLSKAASRIQTERVLENLKAIVEAAGSSLQQVVKTTVFLADMTEFGAMNEVYSRYFMSNPPARSTIEASRLPRNVRVEIDLIALL